MPAYAGFKDFKDYLDQRLARERTNRAALAEAMGWPKSYVHGLYHGQFGASTDRVNDLAKYFGDDPRILRVLLGIEPSPKFAHDKALQEIYDLALGLNPGNRQEAVKYLRYLLDRQAA